MIPLDVTQHGELRNSVVMYRDKILQTTKLPMSLPMHLRLETMHTKLLTISLNSWDMARHSFMLNMMRAGLIAY